MILQGNSIIKI